MTDSEQAVIERDEEFSPPEQLEDNYEQTIRQTVKILEDSERKRPPIRASRFMTLGQQRYRTDEFHRDYISFSED